MSTIKLKIDPKHPPVPTAAQRKRLKALAELPDAQIDLSDDPESPANTIWTRPEPSFPPLKSDSVSLHPANVR